MLAVEQHFVVCIKEIISCKPYGAKSIRKLGEYYDVITTSTALLIPSVTYISHRYLIILVTGQLVKR